MPITNAGEYFDFVSTEPEWENPGWIQNTVVRNRATVHGGDGLWELRRWETELQCANRMLNGKIGEGRGSNYCVNPDKRDDFEGNDVGGTIRQI